MTSALNPASVFARLSARWPHTSLSSQASWIAGPLAVTQLLRLGTNLVLARLLAPEIFGVMLLINTLRTGAELLSDIGIGQSIVRSPNGEDRRFLDVAWTLQALRGALLTLLALALAVPIGEIYDKPDLVPIIVAVSPLFLLGGLQSTSLFLVQRQMRLRTRAIFDFASTLFHCVISIGLALVMPNVWALVLGLVGGMLFSTLLSYRIAPRSWPRLAWDKAHVLEIVHFGKWIFLSTAVYFAASSYDRVFFVGALSLAMAGVYNISRTFADMIGQLAHRAGIFLVFPKVAMIQHRRDEVADRLRATRRKVLALLAVGTGLAIAGSDQFILLAYDERYHAAAFMLPLLLVGVWIGVLTTFGDSTLMGCGRPAPSAWSNVGKFAVMLIGLPWAISQGDIVAALLVLILAEAVRWVILAPLIQREGFGTIGDDLTLTLVMFGVAVAVKSLLGWLGLVPSIEGWWAMRGLLHA